MGTPPSLFLLLLSPPSPSLLSSSDLLTPIPLGNQAARTFDFAAGDTAVFPDNSGHYVENTSDTEDLIWIEIFKTDRIADISLTQWLALTPARLAAQALNVSVEVVRGLKKEKQLIIS